MICVNPALGNSKWPTKIKIPSASLTSIVKDTIKGREVVEEDRNYLVDAAIVRIMKSRRKVLYSDLIADVTSQLVKFFTPDPKFIKLRIEALTEQEFIERDLTNPSLYKYR